MLLVHYLNVSELYSFINALNITNIILLIIDNCLSNPDSRTLFAALMKRNYNKGFDESKYCQHSFETKEEINVYGYSSGHYMPYRNSRKELRVVNLYR